METGSLVFLLQLLANNDDSELKVINNNGQILKKTVIPSLGNPAISNKHLNVIKIRTSYKGSRGKKLTILHQICCASLFIVWR
jgi:hypothetical protein